MDFSVRLKPRGGMNISEINKPETCSSVGPSIYTILVHPEIGDMSDNRKHIQRARGSTMVAPEQNVTRTYCLREASWPTKGTS